MSHKRRFSIHPFAPAGLFLLLFGTKAETTFAILSAVVLHELGHLMAARLCGRRASAITLMPMGISITLPPPASYKEEFLVAAAGPLLNLAYLSVSFFFVHPLGEAVRGANLLLASLNLLPIEGFDGGRMAGALTALYLGAKAREVLSLVMTLIALALLWVLSLYIFFYSGINLSLLGFCAYLFSFLIMKKEEKGLQSS